MRAADARRPPAASLLERTIAYLVDSVVTGLVWLAIVLALTGGSLEGLSEDPTLGVLATFLFLLIPFTYFVLAEAATGTTVGKRWMGLEVHGLDGQPGGLFAVTVRNVLRLAWALGPLAPLFLALDALLVQVSERDQRVGDLAAQTRVIRVGEGPFGAGA